MIEPTNDESPAKPNGEVVTTRVNVAFPFSQLRVEQPSEDVAALADLVRDLIDVLRDIAPSPRVEELGRRAQQLASRLK